MKTVRATRMPYLEAVGYCASKGIMVMGVSLVIIFPLFIAGAFLFIGSPVFALLVKEATCGECGHDIVWLTNRKVVKCRHCKTRHTVTK